MKNLILYFIFAMTVFTSCDFLEEPVLGVETLDSYFANEEECDKYVTGLYAKITNNAWSPVYIWWVITDMCTDDAWIGSTYQPAKYVDFKPITHYEGGSQATTNIYLTDFWEVRYKGIYAANLGIDRISNANISDSKKQQLIAEMKFLRGYFYFELVKNFGGVPLVLTNLNPEEVTKVPRSTKEEVYAQIEKDLTDALVLPVKSKMDYDSGRANNGMVRSLLAKVYLYQEKYKEAHEQLTEVIASKEYDLETDFNNVWSDKDNSIEAIFEIQTSSDKTYGLGNSLPVVTGSRDDSGWAWGGPTSNLQKAFEAQNDDKRRKATIVVSGEAIVGESNNNPYNMTAAYHKSNRIIRKFYIPKAKRAVPYVHNTNKLNYHIIRFADVLLMAAEVAHELGYDNQSRQYLQRVRKRVGLSTDSNLAGDALRDAIREERRLELAFEGQRLFDLRRWKMDDGRTMLEHVMGPDGTFVKYNMEESTDEFETTNQIEPSTKGTSFNSQRDLLFPIPYNDVQLSGGIIEQNPGF